jgi:hypothetical protein
MEFIFGYVLGAASVGAIWYLWKRNKDRVISKMEQL